MLYVCLIEEHDASEGFIHTYWANASHVGEAIDKILAAARANGCRNPIARQIDTYDIENLESDIEPGRDAVVFWSVEKHHFESAPIFAIPVGVIASCMDGEHDIDEIAAGYTLSKGPDGLTCIDVNVESEHLLADFEELLRLYPKYRVFWYVLHDHWDDDEKDLFLINEALNDPARIVRHLRDHYADSVENGYVTLTAYLDEGSTNVRITDHKKIAISTTSEQVAARFARSLEALGYPRQSKLVSIEFGIHHWHYRRAGSRDKRSLAEHLRRTGFSDWTPGTRRE